MLKAIFALVNLIAVLVLVDMSRRTEPILLLRDEIAGLESSVKELTAQHQSLQQRLAVLTANLESGVLVAGQGNIVTDSSRDGKVRLGSNFLLPLDRSSFDASKLGGELRFFKGEPPGFNDMLISMADTSDLNSMVNSALCRKSAESPTLWSEGLATSCVISDDYKVFEFTLRQGVYWQVSHLARQDAFEWLDQRVELTAHDFKFFVDLVVHPDVESGHLKNYYQAMDKVEVIDDYTLRITWKEKEYTNVSFSMGMSPMPRHVYQYDANGSRIPDEQVPILFNDHWFDKEFGLVGVGEYRLDSFTPGKGIRLRRNPSFYGPTEHFETVYWDVEVKEPDAKLVSFKNGQVHYLQGLQPSQFKSQILDRQEERFAAVDPTNPQAGRAGPFGWEKVGSISYSGFCWNMRRPTLSDKRVRQALAHVFPRERALQEIYFGLGKPKRGPVHPDSDYYNANLRAFPFDLEKAKLLLDDAGWLDSDGDGWRDKEIDGKRMKLSLQMTFYGPLKTWEGLVSLYADEAKKVGIEMIGSPVEDKEWSRRSNDRDFDGFAIGWRSGLDVDFKQLWHSDGANDPASSNYPGFANAELDVFADALRTEFSLDKRIEIAQKAQAIIQEEQPYLFVRSTEGIFVWQNRRSSAEDDRQVLDGVIYGLDNYHPMYSRDSKRWYLDKE